jgi:hypothetical protein
MKKFVFLISCVIIIQTSLAQNLTGTQLLDKSIAFHDPDGKWEHFKADFTVSMETPNRPKRVSAISMDFQKQLFTLKVNQKGNELDYEIIGEACKTRLNGSEDVAKATKDSLRLTCDRGHMMKDYYTYLYGLPMKLKDPGTHIDPNVTKKTFKGKEYWVLKATYDAEVGKDTWYFYFDPKTFAMETYQFYHDESKNDGEYILLEGMETINGIHMPKTRKWYYNKDDKFLGTDVLMK